MDIIVSGSLAYDRIMEFPGKFSDHILPEKIDGLNVSFTVSGLVEKLGGTAGNIAYGLSQLDEKPKILASLGCDYQRYLTWLKRNQIPSEGIDIIEEEFTAGAYIITDQDHNQITGFNPGAMKHPLTFDFDQVNPQESLVIIAAGNLEDMISFCKACQTRGIAYIFDPGQSLPIWSGADLAQCLKGAKILISNSYELELIMCATELDHNDLLERTGAIITTLGEAGSEVLTTDAREFIPVVKALKVADPTGAGDAYRAGLISGLVQGKSLKQSALMGSVLSSFAVECHGTQEYAFTWQEFDSRLKIYSD